MLYEQVFGALGDVFTSESYAPVEILVLYLERKAIPEWPLANRALILNFVILRMVQKKFMIYQVGFGAISGDMAQIY